MNKGIEIKTGYYSTVGVEETTPFNFNIGMSLAERASLINTVINTIVNEETKTYYAVLKDYVFMFYINLYMTDIDYDYVFDKEQTDKDYFVNQVEKIISTTNVFKIVSENNKEIVEQMYKALNDALSYKTGVKEELNNVLTSVQHLVNTIFNKVEELDIAAVNNTAKSLSGLTGDITAEKIVGAFQNTDDYKNTEEIIESKNTEIRELKAKVGKNDEDENTANTDTTTVTEAEGDK